MSANKRKGTAHETAVVNYLNKRLGLVNEDGDLLSAGDPMNARRVVQTGRLDQGDAWALPFCLEMKDTAKHDFPGYIKQANAEAKNAGLSFGVAIVKKRNANIKDAYVVMDLETFSRVLADMRGTPPPA